MRAPRVQMYRIDRLAGGNEELISFGATKGQVACRLWEENLTDAFAIVCGVAMNSVKSWPIPAGRGPDITVNIGLNPVRTDEFVFVGRIRKYPTVT